MRFSIPAMAGILSIVASPLIAQTTANAYVKHALVANTASAGADMTDPNLVNPWGNVTSATSPFWVADTGSGLSTVYTSSATALSISGTKPAIPVGAYSGGATKGTATGIVVGGSSFPINGTNSSFVFDTLDGTISGWSGGTTANIAVDNSISNAVYTGLAVATPAGGAASSQLLYAANFYSGKIEVYDTTFKPVATAGTFVDATLPAGYAPFNIWPLTVGGTTKLYVAYTLQDATKKNYAATIGAGVGYVDAFDLNGNLLQHVAAKGVLNAPWGLAIGPANFGKFTGMLLVGNFGDGTINAFDPVAGTSLGPMQDPSGNSIVLPGLWALLAGNGGSGGDTSAIYYTAGGGNQLSGVLGSIQAAPVITTSSVVNAGSLATGAAPNAFLAIFGPNLSPISRGWTTSDFGANGALPTSLDGVSVTIDGKPAYVSFVSPKQVNVLAPPDTTTGPVQVVISNNGLASAFASIQLATYAPSFFISKGTEIAALHADNSVVGATTLFPNVSTPAKPGETIMLFCTGFGATNPAYPSGQVLAQGYPLAITPTVTVGGASATVAYDGLTGAGLYQLNVTIPASTPNGDMPVVATINGVSTQTGAIVTVQGP
jgi:uncharacterized protein (TIGR03118 family)